MRMVLTLHFLGEPNIESPDGSVSLPTRKTEALLFYLALEGRQPRERLRFLLWGDKDERQAASSLRNAVCALRRVLPGNLLSDHGHLQLRDAATDLAAIEKLSDPDIPIPAAVFDEPLRGFDSLATPEFDEWLINSRKNLRARAAEALRTRGASCYERQELDKLAEALSALLVFEPYDEDVMLELMDVYGSLGCAAKAVALYDSFSKKMAEIDVAPSARAQEFLRKLVTSSGCAADKKKRCGEFFCCRETEVKKTLDFMAASSGKTALVFVQGEAGIGKTAFVNHTAELLFGGDAELICAHPISVGEKYPYSALNGFVSQLCEKLRGCGLEPDQESAALLSGVFYGFQGDVRAPRHVDAPLSADRNPVYLGKILARLAGLLQSRKRLCLVFEDLHWFDEQSLLLLKAFLAELEPPACVFMTGRPESVPAAARLAYPFKQDQRFSFLQIQLQPFGAGDVLHFCRLFLPEEVIADKGEKYFIRKSEGMPLLLVEMVRILSENRDADCSDGLRGVITSRLEDMTEVQNEILSVLAVCGQGASADDLAAVMNVDAQEISAPLEALLQKKLLRETREGQSSLFDFLHVNVMECICDSLPVFRRNALHLRIAEVLSRRYSPEVWNPALSAALCHHYKMAGRPMETLKLHLQEMAFHITLNHILFPLVPDETLHRCSIPFSGREETEYKFAAVRELLQELGATETNAEELARMEAKYLEMYGGYLINWGDYRRGRACISRAIRSAREFGFAETEMYCLEHIGHHFLQTDNAAELLTTGRQALRLAKNIGKDNHVGLALRFIGMSRLIERDFDAAEKIFRRSIELFEDLAVSGRLYTLNLLAPRCYIGEMCQWTGRTDEAMESFTYCIHRCSESGLFWGHSHFHAHAADVGLDMGDWKLVEEHADTGVSLFESCKGGHCSSLLYSLKAICDARRGKPQEAAASLKKADFLSVIGKKSWCAPQYMAKAWIKELAETGALDGSACGKYLDKPSGFYAAEAARLYKLVGAEKRMAFIVKKFGL